MSRTSRPLDDSKGVREATVAVVVVHGAVAVMMAV